MYFGLLWWMGMFSTITNKFRIVLYIISLLCISSGIAATPSNSSHPGEPREAIQHPDIVPFTILHVNDIYEMFPLSSGLGGLARIAYLKQHIAQHANKVLCILAGDLLSPSSLSSATEDGVPLYGKHMVDAVNSFLDYMAFGNHEFDIPESALKSRIHESKFTWVASNVFTPAGKPFDKVLVNDIQEITYNKHKIKVGFFALTLGKNKRSWVKYDNDYVAIAKEQVRQLQSKGANVIIAITHLDLKDDIKIAQKVPEIDVVMGGHEHQNIKLYRGLDFTPIYKADYNAKTAYIHNFRYNVVNKSLVVNSVMEIIDADIPEDPQTLQIANKWLSIAKNSFAQQGIELGKELLIAPYDLDGRKLVLRKKNTALTMLIVDSFRHVAQADVGMINGGAIRIEDVIYKGQKITVTDILRILPYESKVIKVKMPGKTLVKMLATVKSSRGTSDFLHVSGNVEFKQGVWYLDNEPIAEEKTYTLASTDYIIYGKARFLKFMRKLEKHNVQIIDANIIDARESLIQELMRIDSN